MKERCKILFSWLFLIDTEDFFSNYWQKTSYHSISKKKDRFKDIFSIKEFKELIQDHTNSYMQDILFIKYVDESNIYSPENYDEMNELNKGQYFKDGQEIKSQTIWQMFEKESVMIKMMSPQKYNEYLWNILSILEHQFGTYVNCDTFLLPSSQFSNSPIQYLDYDMFILQVEGTSSISSYKPDENANKILKEEVIFASQSEKNNDKYMTVLLQQGDIFYSPKGWGYTQKSEYSDGLQLHFTTNHFNSMANILDLVVPQALDYVKSYENLSQNIVPPNLVDFMGVSNSEIDEEELSEQKGNENLVQARKTFKSNIESLLESIVSNTLDMLDAACDQHIKLFMCHRLPVPLTPKEDHRTSSGNPNIRIYPFTKVRMLRPGIARALVEDGMVVVYHCMDNSRDPSKSILHPLEFDLDDGPTIEVVLSAYPEPVEVSELPHPGEELDDKLEIVQALYKEGFLYIEDEATIPYDDGSDDSSKSSSDDDDPF
jgi:hypothetical protein